MKGRKTENIVYLMVWLVVISIYLVNIIRERAELAAPLLDASTLVRIVNAIIPFLVLFSINNWILIPRLLLKNRVTSYLKFAGLLVLLMWGYQYINSLQFLHSFPEDMPPRPHMNHPHPLMPLPLLLDFMYTIIIVGGNMAVALLFQRFEDRLERESLMKSNAENELAYLKAQINPHFYMNMLNNIHGMIEIDPEKAQAMVIDMSQLMRYMLYDSSQTRIPLANEINFLHNYLRIMRRRYPEEKVRIWADFPEESKIRDIKIPPLLFLVFVENAFKHGISYRKESHVTVAVEVEDKKLLFRCINTRYPEEGETKREGIGLRNVSQRLKLIYGDCANLDIKETDEEYIVTLTIPVDENKDTDNR